MNKTNIFLLWLLLPNLMFAQNGLQKCAEEKNKAIIKIVESEKLPDSVITRELQVLNEGWRTCIIGKEIPEFESHTIRGEGINTAALKGKIVVINFWFITCPPCIAEIPAFNRLASEYPKKNVVFIGITFNNTKEVKTFLRKKPFRVKIIPDAGQMEDLFGVLEHPVTFIFDKEGKVKFALTGGTIGDKAEEEAYLKIKPVIDKLIIK